MSQCQATTLKGARCKNTAKGSGLCHVHGGCAKPAAKVLQELTFSDKIAGSDKGAFLHSETSRGRGRDSMSLRSQLPMKDFMKKVDQFMNTYARYDPKLEREAVEFEDGE